MKRAPIALFSALLASGPVAAQELAPDFYAGVLGGISPTYSSEAQYWNDDRALLSTGAFGGVNFRSGNLLYGVEASLATDFGRANQWESYNPPPTTAPSFPRYRSSTFVPGTPVAATTVSTGTAPGGLLTPASLNYSFYEVKARPAVSARMGVTYGNFTVFGKAGIGAALLQQSDVRDETEATYCGAFATQITTSPSFSGNQVQVSDTGCIDSAPGPVTTTVSSTWTPTINYGVGVEYDVDQFFARGEVEMTQFGAGNGSGITRVNLGTGIRF